MENELFKNELLEELRRINQNNVNSIQENQANKGKAIRIQDVKYLGKFDIEHDGITEKKDVYLVENRIDGESQKIIVVDNKPIAREVNGMIIPLINYEKNNFGKLALISDEKTISLSRLEQERIDNIAKVTGLNKEEIQKSAEIDINNTKKIQAEKDVKAIYGSSLNIKSELNPNKRITATDTIGTMIPNGNKYDKIVVIYSNNTSARFKMVGITNEGKVEELEGLEQTEGNNPMEQVISSNRDGSNVNKKMVNTMYKVKGKPNEAIGIKIGAMGTIETDYLRRTDDDNYTSIPIENNQTYPVTRDVKYNIDKTQNSRSDIKEQNKKAEYEIEEHGKADIHNIDDNPNNDIGHDDVLLTEDGKEKSFEDVIQEIEKEQKVSRKEAERLFYNNRDEGETYEKVKDDVEEEVEEQMRINRNNY